MKIIERIKEELKDCNWWLESEINNVENYFNEGYEVDNYNYYFVVSSLKGYKKEYRQLIAKYTTEWAEISKSPYSDSFYSSKDIDWGHKPEGSYRISNHWSFISRGEKHCIIEDETLKNKLLLCKYENGVYKIIKNLSEEWEKICNS